MATTYTLISSNTLSSSAASVTFSAIPSTYTDLVLRVSARTDRASTNDRLRITYNSDTSTNYSNIAILGDGAAASSQLASSATYMQDWYIDGDTATSNTFGNSEIYIPSYLASQNKPVGGSSVMETNATTAYLGAVAALWRNTAAITSINITKIGTNFVSGSSFYLYGIKNSQGK